MRLPALFVLVLTACGSPDETSSSSTVSTTPPSGELPDPATYDCRAASAPPDRASAVPVDCALDPACATRLVAAHRGGGGQLGILAPEDTLSGYRAGIAIGVELVETDPRPTADGVLVNLHDDTVDRTTDGTGAADTFTLAEIQALHIDPGPLDGDFACERIPTLREVLALARGRVTVLVDANKTDRVDLLVGDILAEDALEWAIFDTSDLAKIAAARALAPGLHVMNRPASADVVASEAETLGVIPVFSELDSADLADGIPAVHAAGTRAFTDAFFQDASAGLTGDTAIYDELLDLGLDAIQTDRPDLVLAHLRERGER